jgi:hypothetical protein
MHCPRQVLYEYSCIERKHLISLMQDQLTSSSASLIPIASLGPAEPISFHISSHHANISDRAARRPSSPSPPSCACSTAFGHSHRHQSGASHQEPISVLPKTQRSCTWTYKPPLVPTIQLPDPAQTISYYHRPRRHTDMRRNNAIDPKAFPGAFVVTRGERACATSGP